ncbi:MAG: sialidase family protein [Gammaproteobacteria bacterium]|nr:sialidase family protein [Gammaproteobacteria bacterium]
MGLVDVYTAGHAGVHTYRIPALAVTRQGTLLAFAEARHDGPGDAGDIDLVVRRSADAGRTWSTSTTVWDDGRNTCGNPAPVVDAETGRIVLPMTWNHGRDLERDIIAGRSREPRRAYVTASDDDGVSWAQARELPELRQPQWGWYATGPGNAIQIGHGQYKGRIVAPANHSDRTGEGHFYRAHVICSDDAGESWFLGGVAGPATNESAVAELGDGSLLLNMRSYAGRNRRALSVSRDGGATWSAPQLHEALVEPVCQGSMIRSDAGPAGHLLFSNPDSETAREGLTVRASADDGATWQRTKVVYAGSAAYSSMAVLPDGRVGIVFERDRSTRISFAAFNLEELIASPLRRGPA